MNFLQINLTNTISMTEVIWILIVSPGLFLATLNWRNAHLTRDALDERGVDGTFGDVQTEIIWQDGLRALQFAFFWTVGLLAMFVAHNPNPPPISRLSFITIWLLYGAMVVMDYNTFRNHRFNARYKPLREEVKKSAKDAGAEEG